MATVEQPSIVWKGAATENRRQRYPNIAPEGLVLHIMEGTLEGCASWFNTPPAGRPPGSGPSSTHFGVGKDGRIWQFVALGDAAYAHGSVETPEPQATRLVRENWGVNPNDFLIGIEHEGKSGDAMTALQFDASTRLAAWLFATVLLPGGASGVAVDRDHVLRHGEISPRTRSGCPGYPEQTIAAYINRVRELLESAPPAPPVDPHAECKARQAQLLDALTLQAAALDEIAARATIQAANLRRVVTAG